MNRRGERMTDSLEEPSFDLTHEFSDFEIRRYADTVQARVQTSGRGGGAPSGGFRRVAGYIFGGNKQRASIAMTTPVSMWEEEGSGWLAFTMPSAYSLTSLPEPNDEGVRLVAHPGAMVAVKRFTGRTTPKKTERIERTLRAAAEREGYRCVGPPVLAVYENPWTTLPFRRRNEIHVEIEPIGPLPS
jgi:hypothetical protein